MRYLPLLFGLLLLGACPQSTALSEIRLGSESFRVEVADDDASRARGLMDRASMPSDQGMLFVWPDESHRAFWMKNTLIPLDILYFDSRLQLVDMHLDVQPCRSERCPSYPSARPARYVVELNAGTARRIGLQLGDRLEIRRR